MRTQRASPGGETRSIHRLEPRVFLVTLTIQVLISLGTFFEAGSDFGQIGPTVSAAVTAAARSFAPAKNIYI
jgi:hypothetical protein